METSRFVVGEDRTHTRVVPEMFWTRVLGERERARVGDEVPCTGLMRDHAGEYGQCAVFNLAAPQARLSEVVEDVVAGADLRDALTQTIDHRECGCRADADTAYVETLVTRTLGELAHHRLFFVSDAADLFSRGAVIRVSGVGED